jgi:hypothetical protein
MLLDLGRAVSFFASILSLYWVMMGAFFVPGSRLREQLAVCAIRVAIAACICFASGLLFSMQPAASKREKPSALSTLPMKLFFWGLGGMAILFVVSWYIEDYYLPLTGRG